MISVVSRLRDALTLVVREFVKFGVVGAIAFVVDVALFNLMLFGAGVLGDPDNGRAVLEGRPLTAKAVSVTAATLVAWLGNRNWTFRRRRRASARSELALFATMNVAGMLIALVCLGVSHYLLGLDSPVADNVSANMVGLVLGTAFRFYAYRTWVFTEGAAAPDHDVHPAAGSLSPGTGTPRTPAGGA